MQLANNNNPKIQSIHKGQNQVPSYFFFFLLISQIIKSWEEKATWFLDFCFTSTWFFLLQMFTLICLEALVSVFFFFFFLLYICLSTCLHFKLFLHIILLCALCICAFSPASCFHLLLFCKGLTYSEWKLMHNFSMFVLFVRLFVTLVSLV